MLVNIPFVMTNGTDTLRLFCGIDPYATDSIDEALGEYELPPFPPSEVFDVRFTDYLMPSLLGNGVQKDYRFGSFPFTSVIIHRLYLQKKQTDELKIIFKLPAGVTGNISDEINGQLININFEGNGETNVPNVNISYLKLKLNYSILTHSPRILDRKDYLLFQNYPNPFNPSTNIKYELPVYGFVTLKIFDLLGNEVAALVDENKEAGKYQIEFNALNLSNGVYFYELRAGNFRDVKKLILLK